MKPVRMFSIFAAGAVALFLTGATSCEEILNNPDAYFDNEVDQTPSYVISLHDIIKYRRGDMMEKEVDAFAGGTVCVNKNS